MKHHSILCCAASFLAVAIFAAPASAITIFVDQNAQWRYVNATAATTQAVPANWFDYAFNDSGWSLGNAPFTNNPNNPGSSFGGDLGNAGGPWGGVAPPIPSTGTQWDVPNDPYLRVYFNLPSPQALTVWLAVDNGVNSMYINGVSGLTSAINAEGQGFRWENVFDIGSQYTFAGLNVLALQLEDHGGATAFDLVITSDDTAQNPIFTNGPPPTQPGSTGVPEPLTLSLFGAGLAGAAALRRRRK